MYYELIHYFFFEHVTVVLDGLSLQAISVILTLHYIFFCLAS